MEEGSATDFVTDVTDARNKVQGRMKKSEGRRNLQLMFQQLRTSSSSGVVAIEGRSLKKE